MSGTPPAALSAATVYDESVGQIIRRHGDGDAVTGNDFDVEPTKPPAYASEKCVALVALHAEVPTGQCLDHLALDLDEIVSCHSIPFCRLNGAIRIPMHAVFVDIEMSLEFP